MASVVFFADKPQKEASGPTKQVSAPKDEDGYTGPSDLSCGHMIIEPVSLTPSTPACNLMNQKYRDEKVQNMQPMQTEWPDAHE